MLEVPPNEDLRKKLESYSDEKLIDYLKNPGAKSSIILLILKTGTGF